MRDQLSVCSASGIMTLGLFLFSVLIATCLSQNPSFNEGQNKKSLGRVRCQTDSNCTLNAYCFLGACSCKDGYSPYREPTGPRRRDYKTICLKEASFIGDHCTVDVQCKATFGNHAKCQLDNPSYQVGRCECLEDAHYKDGLCYKTSIIGGSCEVNDNCLIKSKELQAFCEYSRCICPPNHHPTNDGTDCQPSSGLGGPCKDNAGCMVLNSECKHGLCRCGSRYIASEKKNYCLALREKLGDPCEEHSQCLTYLQNTRCHEDKQVCVCEPGTHVFEGSCWHSAKLLGPCEYNAECYVNKTTQHSIECNNGLCQCKNGYALEEQKHCIKEALEPCEYNTTCFANETTRLPVECYNGICQCENGFALEEQKYCVIDNTTIPNPGIRLSPSILVHPVIFIVMIEISSSFLK